MLKKNSKLLLLVLTILVLLPLVIIGCSKKTAENEEKEKARKMIGQADVMATGEKESIRKLISPETNEVTVYYLTSNEEYLVPVTIPVNATEQGAKAAIERLIVGSADEAIKPVINTSTKLREIYLQGNQVYLDITNHFLNYKTEELGEMAVTSILKTLAPFTGDRLVQILIEGEAVNVVLGKYDLSEPVILEYDQPESNKDEHIIIVYYTEQNGLYLVPVKKRVITPDPLKAAMTELVKGPGEQSGLIPTMWHGTKVYDVNLTGDVVEINLSEEAIGYGGGSAAESLFIRSLLLTLTEFPEVNWVQLLFEGEKIDFLPEGTEVDKPLPRPDYINFRY